MRTQVCITVDTEFSIADTFTNLRDGQPLTTDNVWCPSQGKSQGLGFMLELFKQYGIEATFFLEALHRHYFRDDPMRHIAHTIQTHGHELQLHIHPVWSVFHHSDWLARVRAQPRQDDFCGRPVAESQALIKAGQAAFDAWQLPPPTVFRSGNLQYDPNLYQALAACGIHNASNIGLAIFNNGAADYQLYSGIHSRKGVRECPVLSYSDWQIGNRRHLKTATIIGSSFAEIRHLLWQARQIEIPLIVILTHPFEYIHSRDDHLRDAIPNRRVQKRLEHLCRFLHNHQEHFSAVGMAHALEQTTELQCGVNQMLRVPLSHALPRMVVQAADNVLSRIH